MTNPIILFDGVCNLCNGFVQFVIKRDKLRVFRFGALQSEKAQSLLKSLGRLPSGDLTTIVLLDGERMDTESDAILKIAQKLSGVWRFFFVFIVLPKPPRDAFYRFVARHRYHIFGQRDACMVPTPELMHRFI